MFGARRTLACLVTTPALVVAACGTEGAEDPGTAAGRDREPVALVGQMFTEADIVTQIFRLLLEKEGFEIEVKDLGARELYLEPLRQGEVQVAADYLSSLAEELNRMVNGEDAAPVSGPDAEATFAELEVLAVEQGITPLQPAAAELTNAFAVTREFAKDNDVRTLSDLGELGRPVALAASPECPERRDCARGLESVYGIELSRVEPLGHGTDATKGALRRGQVQLGQVDTTDGSLAAADLLLLEDDRDWQHAENLVPVVNTEWIQAHPEAREALNQLSAVLTTRDLVLLNAEVDGEGRKADAVAEDYLEEKGLL